MSNDSRENGHGCRVTELAVGTWVATALVGAYMWTLTADAGRPESNARATRLPSLLLFLHPLVGLSGFASWLAYVYSDASRLAWVALGFLLVGALIGDVLVVRTLRRSRETHRTVAGQDIADRTYAEDRIPRAAIAAHGALALTTIALVLAVALSA